MWFLYNVHVFNPFVLLEKGMRVCVNERSRGQSGFKSFCGIEGCVCVHPAS